MLALGYQIIFDYDMDEKVRNYFKNLPSPQQEICKKLRKIILDTFPSIYESFKNGVPWYEGRFYLVGFKDHVNIGFSVSGMGEEEMKNFEGKGKYLRHIKVLSIDEVHKEKIVKLLKMVK
jgi:hypothetical protein